MTVSVHDAPLFAKITSAQLEKMMKCAAARQLTYQPGEYLMREGKNSDVIQLILSGLCREEKVAVSGQRQILAWIYPNDIVGEQVFCQQPVESWCDVIAAKQTETLAIPAKFFFGVCSNVCPHHLTLTHNMLSILSQKSVYQLHQLYLTCGHSIREKVGLYLFEQMDADGWVHLTMNREELADYLGITRPSLSRELSRLAQSGLITYQKNHIHILRADAYKSELEV